MTAAKTAEPSGRRLAVAIAQKLAERWLVLLGLFLPLLVRRGGPCRRRASDKFTRRSLDGRRGTKRLRFTFSGHGSSIVQDPA